jgi:2-methylcitrate dehydratase
MANAAVAQTAVFQTLLAAAGLTGPLQALEGSRGVSANVLSQRGISGILAPAREGAYRIMDSHLKAFPCLGTAQALVAAALTIRPHIEKRLDDIESIEITMADLPAVASQISDQARRYPTSREAADHSFYFLPVVALIDGELGARQFEDRRWEDSRVKAVMDRITIGMDIELNRRAPASFPARLQVTMRGGETHAAEAPYPPGHPKNMLTMEGIVGKFTRHRAAKTGEIDWARLARAIETLDSAPDLGNLLSGL